MPRWPERRYATSAHDEHVRERVAAQQLDRHDRQRRSACSTPRRTPPRCPRPRRARSGSPRTRASTLPSVAPTKKSGVTSPPRKPQLSVTAVKTSFAANANHGRFGSVKERTIIGTPRPEVVARPDELPHDHDGRAADEHPERQPHDAPLEDVLQPMRELDERDRRHCHRDADERELPEDEGRELHVRDRRVGACERCRAGA